MTVLGIPFDCILPDDWVGRAVLLTGVFVLAGVALSNLPPAARSVGAWFKGTGLDVLGYGVGCAAMRVVQGPQGHPINFRAAAMPAAPDTSGVAG